MYPGKGTVVLIRPAQTFYERIKLESCEPSLQVEQTPFVPGLDQLVNQSSGGGEAHGQSPLTRSQTETEGDMGLAGATVAESDDVVGALDVLASCQLQNQSLVQEA